LQRIYGNFSPFGCIYRPGKDMDHRRYRRRLARRDYAARILNLQS
jgi:hypothetical protein